MKKNQTVWALYVSLTTNFINFKIEKGKYLGKVKDLGMNYKSVDNQVIVEHDDNNINYINKEDVFLSQRKAELGLLKLLKDKYE